MTKIPSFKEALLKKLSEREVEDLNKSFEIIGDIGILEINSEKIEYDTEKIAEAFLESQKNVNIVLNKIGDIQDIFRVGKYEIIGKRNIHRDFSFIKREYRPKEETETIHTENGYRLKLDPTKVYFSSKLGFERMRIKNLVKDNEKILVLFAGIGPFPLCLAKYRNVDIKSVEINPEAVKYFRENIQINRLKGNIEIFEGDARDVMKDMDERFDRIIMPAPKDAPDFLEDALKLAKKGTIVHLYSFASEEEFRSKTIEKQIKSKAEVIILNSRICGNIGIRQHRVVVDFQYMGP